MPNAITLPKGYQTALDEVYRLASVTDDLTSDASDLMPTQNVNEFCYPQIEVGGLGNYDRASGYTANSGVNLVWKTAKANYDRGTKITVDFVDNQETFDLAFGKAGATLMRDKVAPESDAFTFATLAGLTGISIGAPATFADGTAFLNVLLAAKNKMDEDEVPQEGRLLYATFTLLNSVIALDTTKSREALQHFTVKQVPQTRFYTAIDMLDGKTTGEEAGHFKKATAGKDINFMVIHKPAIIKYDKHVASDVIDPAVNTDSDAYISKYRKYGIVGCYENKRAGIYLSHKA